MKKQPLLNAEISRSIASLGHGDLLVLADAGHAIPRDADRIDIALRPGVPSMLQVLETVLTELRVEAYVVCEGIVAQNRELDEAYQEARPGVGRIEVPYSKLRSLVREAKSVIRTGEMTAHANLILQRRAPLRRLPRPRRIPLPRRVMAVLAFESRTDDCAQYVPWHTLDPQR